MSGQLLVAGDGPAARCKHCGKPAVGPCARCRGLVCGDCCVLTDGGVGTFAVCLTCERRGGATLRGAWLGLLGWLAVVVLVLAGVAAAVVALR
ncbi:MAG: hypothetical protein KC464_24655 [Myxococcales bacterium]|nr:hypothetical protein [Myxococcales bacterium]